MNFTYKYPFSFLCPRCLCHRLQKSPGGTHCASPSRAHPTVMMRGEVPLFPLSFVFLKERHNISCGEQQLHLEWEAAGLRGTVSQLYIELFLLCECMESWAVAGEDLQIGEGLHVPEHKASHKQRLCMWVAAVGRCSWVLRRGLCSPGWCGVLGGGMSLCVLGLLFTFPFQNILLSSPLAHHGWESNCLLFCM